MKPAKPKARTSLLNQALAANVVLVGTSLACMAGFLTVQQRWVLQDQLEARAGLLAESLASQSELAMLVRNRPELERISKAALSNEDVLYARISDRLRQTGSDRRPPRLSSDRRTRPAGGGREGDGGHHR